MTSDGIEALRRRFVERTRREGAVIEQWQASGGPVSAEIERLVHNLAGAAGTFGYAELNAAAARIDDRLLAQERPSPGEVRGLLEEIEHLP